MRFNLRNLFVAMVAIATLASCSDEPFKPVGLLQDLGFTVSAEDTGEGQPVPFSITLDEGNPSLTYTLEVTLDGNPLQTITGPAGDITLPYDFKFPGDFSLPPLEPGTHTLTVTITCGGQVWTKTITFTVFEEEDPAVHVTSVVVPTEDVVLEVGEKKEIEIYALPLNATDRQVAATPADATIASVTQNEPNAVLWTIEGLKVGATTVTCVCDGKEATFKVTVVDKSVKSIEGPDEITVKVGESETLYYTVKPEDAADKTLTGEIMNTSIATVKATAVAEGSFVVTGVKVGSTTLVVSSANGLSKTTKVKVVEKTSEDIKVIDDGGDGGQGGSGDIQDIKDITMKVGDSRNLKFVLLPEGVSDQSVTVTVSDPKIVSADGTGLEWTFTGLEEGEVTVIVKNGDTEKTFRITVTAPVPTGINAPESLTVTEGSSIEFGATRVPVNAAGTMEASTEKSSIATVTALGSDKFRINGITPGKTRIKVYIGDVCAYVNVTVVEKEAPVINVTSIKANPSSLALVEGETGSFTVTVSPYNATDADNVTVKSNNTSVATVKYSGGKYIVTGVAPGTTTITVSCGGKTATVSVTVKAATVDVTGIHVPGDQTLVEGSTKDVSVYVTPTNATDQTISVTSSSTSVAKIEKTSGNTYRITGVSEGTATITAKSSNGKTGTFKVTVTHKAVDVTSVSVNPTSLTIYEGETGDFTVTVTPSNADEAGNASASSSSTSVATVRKGTSGKFTVTGVKEGTATITVTCGGKSATVAVTVKKKDVTTYQSYLVVTLSKSSVEIGETATATVKKYTDTYVNGQLTQQDKTGTSVSNSDCSWSSDKTSVATVSNGTVTGVAAGSATITAKLKSDPSCSGSASVTVKKPEDVITHELSISPSSASIAEGESITFSATYYTLTNGVKDSGTDVTASATWSVKSGSSYVTSNGKGKFSWKGGAGTATVQASYSGETATAIVTTSAHVPVETTGYELELLGDDITVEAGKTATVNRSAKYYTIKYIDGVEQSRTPQTVNATLSSSATGVATVSGSTVTGKAEGTAYLSGTYNGTTASNRIKVTVTAPAPVITHELALSPTSATLSEGESVTFSAICYTVTDGVKDSGKDVTSSASWSVKSGGSYVTSNGNGRFTWKGGAGTATAQATYEGISATASITTKAHVPVESYRNHTLTLKGSPVTVEVGGTASVSAAATFSVDLYLDGVYSKTNTNNVTATLYSNNSNIASVSGTTVSGKAAGSTALYGKYNSITSDNTIAVTVTDPAPTLDYIELVMDPDEMSVGEKSYGTVTAHYSDGSTSNVTSKCTWSSNAPGGTFTGTKSGAFTVTAHYGGESDDAEVIVHDKKTYELVVTPASQTIDSGETAYCTATFYTYTNGVSNGGVDVSTSATWSIVSGSSVTNDAYGRFSWLAKGTSTVKATYSGYSDTAVITCNAAPAPTLSYITVEPWESTIYVGKSTYVDVIAHYSDGTTVDVTREATVTSSAYTSFDDDKGELWSVKEDSGACLGSKTITATYGGKSANGSVTVISDFKSISMNFNLGYAGDSYASVTYHPGLNDSYTFSVKRSGVISNVWWSTTNITIKDVDGKTISIQSCVTSDNLSSSDRDVVEGDKEEMYIEYLGETIASWNVTFWFM